MNNQECKTCACNKNKNKWFYHPENRMFGMPDFERLSYSYPYPYRYPYNNVCSECEKNKRQQNFYLKGFY